MPYCTRCGKEIQEGERCSCQKHTFGENAAASSGGMPIHRFFGLDRQIGSAKIMYERGMQIVPENLAADENEKPIRQYDLCTLRSRIKLMRAEGRLQVTNKRILFRAKGRSVMGPTILQHEFSVSELSGFRIIRNFRFSVLDLLFVFVLSTLCLGAAAALGMRFALSKAYVLLLILSYLVGAAGIASTYFLGKHYISKSCLAALAAGLMGVPAVTLMATGRAHDNGFFVFLSYLLYLPVIVAVVQKIVSDFLFSFKPNLQFEVVTKMGSSVIDLRCERGGFFGQALMIHAIFTGYNEVLPTAQTDDAIREVGAIISDLHTMGDAAVAKWKKD